MKTQMAPVMFSLEEAAAICEIAPQQLRDWIRDGVIVPTQPGGKGRGRSHRFSAQLVWGITHASWLWESPRGCRLTWFAEEVKKYGKWSWEALAQLLGLERDAWREETLAKALGPRPMPWESGPSQADVEFATRLFNRIVRLRDAIKKRLEHEGQQRSASIIRQM